MSTLRDSKVDNRYVCSKAFSVTLDLTQVDEICARNKTIIPTGTIWREAMRFGLDRVELVNEENYKILGISISELREHFSPSRGSSY